MCLQMSVSVLNVGKTSNKHFPVSFDVSRLSASMFSMIVVQLFLAVRAVSRQIQAFAKCKFAPFQTVVFLSNICNVC